MPMFEVEQYELHVMKHRVEAQNEAEAIAKLFNGEAEPVCDSQEFVEVASDYGLPSEEHRELADQLHSLGVSMDEAVIPSIRTIVRVDQQELPAQRTPTM